MGKKIKKIISILAVAAVILVCSIPLAAKPVKAEEEPEPYKVVLYGNDGDAQRTGIYVDENGEEHIIGFLRWDETDRLPDSPGDYYLSQNITMTEDFIIQVPGCVNLCLNGKTITISQDRGIEMKYDNTIINIYDTSGGLIKTSDTSNSDQALHIMEGTVNMYGGTICESNVGVRIGAAGTFNMYSGAISQNGQNAMYYSGGGVKTSGTFNMYGGTISNNIGDGGMGVSVNGIFRMYGGTITNNTSDGIGYAVDDLGDFYLYGGSIVGNTNENGKADVIIVSSNFVRSGGEIGSLAYVTNSFNVWSNIIKFNPNGGSGTMYDAYVWNSSSENYGTITLPPNAYEKEGYRFLSWNTKADGSGESYLDGAEITGVQAEGGLTLYAQWEAVPSLSETQDNADANDVSASTTPQTGDNSGLAFYVSLSLAAGAGVALTFKKAKFEK